MRVARVDGQELMVLVLASTVLSGRVAALKLVENPAWQPSVDILSDEVGNGVRPSVVLAHWPLVKPEELSKKSIREASCPRQQPFGNVCGQNALQFVPLALCLEPRSFVDEGGDTSLCEGEVEHVRRVGHPLLVLLELRIALGLKDGAADLRENVGPITHHQLAAMLWPKADW